MAEQHTRRRRGLSQRSRTTVEVVLFVVAVFFLGWGADSLTRLGAESLMARNIQHATGVLDPPTVHVRGFAFLPQVVRGAYGEVDVTTRGIPSGPLRIEQVDSRLFDVRVPFHDVLVQDIRTVGIGRSVEDVVLRYPDLNSYFEVTGRALRLAPAGNGEVEIAGSVIVLGQQVPVRGTVTLSVSDALLRITPTDIDTGSVALTQAGRLLLQLRLNLTVPMSTLPFGHQLTSASANSTGILLRAEGAGIVVQP